MTIALDSLVINEVPIPGHPTGSPWWVTDFSALLDGPRLRGEDRTVGHEPGQQAYPWMVDATVLSFPFEIFGDVDPSGDPYPAEVDMVAGLEANRDYLDTNLGIITVDGIVPVVAFEWHRHAGDVLGADVHVQLTGGTTIAPGVFVARLDVAIPAGRLTTVGS